MMIKLRETYDNNGVKKPIFCGLMNLLQLIYILWFIPTQWIDAIPVILSLQYHLLDIEGCYKYQRYADYIGLLTAVSLAYKIEFSLIILLFIVIETLGFIFMYDSIYTIHRIVLGMNLINTFLNMQYTAQNIFLLIAQVLVGLWLIMNPVDQEELKNNKIWWSNHETFHLMIFIAYVVHSYLFLIK